MAVNKQILIQFGKRVHEAKNLLIENEKVILAKNIDEIEIKIKTGLDTLEPTKKFFLDCNTWAKQFLTLSEAKKQEVVNQVLWNLAIKDRNIVSYQMKSPYSIIANLPENADFSSKLPDLESLLLPVETHHFCSRSTL